jgi:hypothetical protein
LLFFALAMMRAYGPQEYAPRDFFIYRLGAELAARGETPYDVAKIQHHVAERFPDPNPTSFFAVTGAAAAGDLKRFPRTDPNPDSFPRNCGYFLPPLAVLVYMPFALLPWGAATVAWAVVNGLAAYFIARLPLLFRPKDSPPPLFFWLVVPFLLVMNPLAQVVVFPVGQTSVMFVGFVAAGLLAFEKGRPPLAAVLWVVPFIKPHLALPLIPLAWYLGGWRPAALLVLLVGVLNLIGATVIGGSPLYLREYFDYLPQTRNVVRFNRAGLNPSIASWNRLLFAAGGPLVELGLLTTLAGYLVWYGLLAGRWALAGGERPSAAWAAAATAAGAVVCSQVLVYELLFLAVAMPWVRDLFLGGYRVRGVLAVVLMSAHLMRQAVMDERFHIAAHHPICVALFALLVLTGPIGSGTRVASKSGGQSMTAA